MNDWTGVLFGVYANNKVYARKQVVDKSRVSLGEFYDATDEMQATFTEMKDAGDVDLIAKNMTNP